MENFFKKYNKAFDTAYLIIINVVKVVFWFIFANLFLLQTIIAFNMLNDLPNELESITKAITLYIILVICFIVGLFWQKKLLKYMSALCIILLFIYLSALPDLNLYYGYFDGLD
ncbi:MAG: hypothetical protein II830_01005 [Alphaproteobacteria bacterium]|nr:hypothetical protein [Alphaproteobacteria bacterium]